jgi:hypothetical protein
MKVSVTRAAWRPVVYALFAIPMVILAVDMMVAHRWFPEPDTTEVSAVKTLEDGSTVDTTIKQLTMDGKAQQRREIVWGIGLLIAGAAAATWGLKDLMFPRRVVTTDADFLTLRVGPRVSMVLRYAWSDVVEVRSGVLEDEAGPSPVLSLRFVDDSLVPPDPWGAVAEPPWLHLYAIEWDRQAHEVAPIIEGHISCYRGPADEG